MTLGELQVLFGHALLDGKDEDLVSLLLDEGMPARARLDFYRNSVVTSLTSVLRRVFPEVCRLLGERAFRMAAEAYIRGHPPQEPCLDTYGERFAEFLSDSGPYEDLPDLPELAQLEWLARRAVKAPEAADILAEPERM
jgi:hypothetical protein